MSWFTRILKENPYHDANGLFSSRDASESVTMTKVSPQKGSNPGGVYENAAGEKHYVKFYSDPQQGHTEQLCSSLFEMIGASTPAPKMGVVNGTPALVTKWNPDLERLKNHEFHNVTASQADQIGKMYAASVLLKNWDVVGLEHDNIVRDKKTGNMVEVDTGGSMEFRAMGSHKDYGPDIAELKSLKNPALPSGQVFNAVFSRYPQSEINGMKAVKNLDLSVIKRKFESSGLKNASKLYDTFVKRRGLMLAAYNLS